MLIATISGFTAWKRKIDGEIATRLGRFDVLLAGGLFATACALYVPLGLRLAEGSYFDYYNLAFDLDPPRTLQTLALSPPDLQGVRHPLIVLLRPLAWCLVNLGIEPKKAGVLEMVTFGSATVASCFLFLRLARAAWIEATALALLFTVTNTQIFTSIIVESYGFAGFSIVFVWLVALARLETAACLRGVSILSALLTFGVTITNVVQPLIAEMLVWSRRKGIVEAFRQTIAFSVLLGAIAALLAAFVWFDSLLVAAQDPILAIKQIWWLQTKAYRTGLMKVLETFFAFSFVAPHYSWLVLEDGMYMRDFRDWSFSPLGSIAVGMWLVFFSIGTVYGFRHQMYRWIALGLAIAIAFNVLFHVYFQFRGSVFLYAAHLHFLIFALGAGMAPWMAVRSLWTRSIYTGIVLIMTLLIGTNNIRAAAQFVSEFDNVWTPCSAPCGDGPM